MSKFLLAMVFCLSGVQTSNAQMQILALGKSDLTGLSMQKNEAFRCRDNQQEFAFEFKISTASGPYHRIFCPDSPERAKWETMYNDLLTLFAGVQNQACIVSENCHRWGCDRTYGRTRADIHQVIVTTSAGNRIEDYRVNLQLGCYL